MLHQSANGKHQLGNLQIIYLCKEVRLVLYRIFRCPEPRLTVTLQGSGVMSGSRIIKVFSDTLFKAAKLNKFVAHHIRIGCQPLLNLINGIGRHIVPILAM